MNSIRGKLILIQPQKNIEFKYAELNFIPEDTDFIQDHRTFEDRRQQLIDEYEKELRNFRNNTMRII
ncbi:hypothetical protein LY28_03055 [Ruminiclostridium sufflavum DSM 19573]|uniref:Uncharacterized protein n=1 Tax=Ruminiclostridium sufflavum DSM 19573 TaxID=1121337 RepID=A0A318XIZ0_9FIRM|nr:hypothetical protein [Ruminiclostridium sufflavum]PYG85901.1 hypothetical protein LY28_03055 [Ruminiclostridium sufflavum DSM 19573]